VNLSEMISFVRAQADADINDAPDALLTVYARAAYQDIRERVYPWPDKFVEYEFNTVAGQVKYRFTDFVTAPDLKYVVGVMGPTDGLVYVDFQTYTELSEGRTIRSRTREADVFAVKDDSLWLYPEPTEAVGYTVFGYRAFADWPQGSAAPDLPRGFDEAICWYMLAMYHRREEDIEMAGMYSVEFEKAVNRQIAAALRSSNVTASSGVLGGAVKRHLSIPQWIQRNVENQ
jgi:hypothetical protein